MENCLLPFLNVSRPIWLMRQAGRYLPEYRHLRSQQPNFLKFCYSPKLCTEAVLQPIRRYDLDFAIVFSDILVIPDALGQNVRFDEGRGPLLEPLAAQALTSNLCADGLSEYLRPVYDGVARMKSALNGKPLIGFSGAVWTLACYMVEGFGSRDFSIARTTALRDQSFPNLAVLLERCIIEHLSQQIEAGADIVQIFDSWAGVLSAEQFDRWVVAPTRRITTALKQRHSNVPVIAFPRGAGEKVFDFAEKTGVDAVSLDETADLRSVLSHCSPETVLQGNLDPLFLLDDPALLSERISALIGAVGNRPWIFNLGHGVHKETDPKNVARLVDLVRSLPKPQP